MIQLCYGHKPCPIYLSTSERYFPEQLLNFSARYSHANQPISLMVCNKIIPIRNQDELIFAAEVAAQYHNGNVTSAPFDDNWHDETLQMEEEAVAIDNEETECSSDCSDN